MTELSLLVNFVLAQTIGPKTHWELRISANQINDTEIIPK